MYNKLGNKPSYTRVDKSDLQVYPYFTDLATVASYQVKSRDKLVNHSCQLMCSLACFQAFM